MLRCKYLDKIIHFLLNYSCKNLERFIYVHKQGTYVPMVIVQNQTCVCVCIKSLVSKIPWHRAKFI